MFQTARNILGISSQPAIDSSDDEVFTVITEKDTEIREYYADECRCDKRDSDCLEKCVYEGDITHVPEDLCQCEDDDKDCLFACVDDTDPCAGDGVCGDSRDFIVDQCECKDDDKECLMMCVDDAMGKCNDVCFDQDYKCLEPCFQSPRTQLSGKRDGSAVGKASGSLSASAGFGLGLGSLCILAVVAAVAYKKRQANKTPQ